jgi:hypothetical protein
VVTCRHPRFAAKRFSERWLQEIDRTRPGDTGIGSTGLDTAPILLLQARAKLLLDLSADDANWPD